MCYLEQESFKLLLVLVLVVTPSKYLTHFLLDLLDPLGVCDGADMRAGVYHIRRELPVPGSAFIERKRYKLVVRPSERALLLLPRLCQ